MYKFTPYIRRRVPDRHAPYRKQPPLHLPRRMDHETTISPHAKGGRAILTPIYACHNKRKTCFPPRSFTQATAHAAFGNKWRMSHAAEAAPHTILYVRVCAGLPRSHFLSSTFAHTVVTPSRSTTSASQSSCTCACVSPIFVSALRACLPARWRLIFPPTSRRVSNNQRPSSAGKCTRTLRGFYSFSRGRTI